MGQKVNPNGMRLGINKTWSSFWYADKKDIAKNIKEDNVIRNYILKEYKNCAISNVLIERTADVVTVTISTAKPGVMIGQKGAGVEALKANVEKLSDAKKVNVNVVEVKNMDLDAKLVAESIAAQLEKRAQFRRVMKAAMQRTMRAGAMGIKTMVSGRLDGAEIARSEHYHEGSLPLHTIRANIDYAVTEAHTTFGVIGVKVWIYKGEIMGKVSQSTVSNHKKGEN
ncbi:MAG: 30S ribosomal protein S3 [Clostridia bacterium]|nr:30S ribosomal protein S3 [Clostridia bacterium]MCQ2564420.1 30S ribosomal protein S3 [Clostridia bacterium]